MCMPEQAPIPDPLEKAIPFLDRIRKYNNNATNKKKIAGGGEADVDVGGDDRRKESHSQKDVVGDIDSGLKRKGPQYVPLGLLGFPD